MSFRIRISYLLEILFSFSCDRNEAQRRPNCSTSHAIFTMRHYFSHERTMKGYARRSAYKSDLFIQLQIISPNDRRRFRKWKYSEMVVATELIPRHDIDCLRARFNSVFPVRNPSRTSAHWYGRYGRCIFTQRGAVFNVVKKNFIRTDILPIGGCYSKSQAFYSRGAW